MINSLSDEVRLGLMADFPFMEMSPETADNYVNKLLGFEISYGQYAESPYRYQYLEYGVYSEEIKNSIVTLDELADICPAFPIKGILAKLKKDSATGYSIPRRKWLETFNELWTADNLEIIKLMAQAMILDETRPFRDCSVLNELREQYLLGKKDPI